MKIGILGTGDVGQALGNAFVTLGHDVKMGSRSAQNEKSTAWAQAAGPTASTGTFADATRRNAGSRMEVISKPVAF